MTIHAPEGVGAAPVTGYGLLGSPPSSETTASTQTDKDMFMELLVAQLRYQDPLNPTDSGQFLAQSAQFTALEKMEAVAEQTAMLLSTQLAFGASGLVGREVSWTDAEGATHAGQVSGVTFGAQGPVLDVDGTEVPLAQVVSVTQSAAATDPSDPSGTGSTGSTDTPAQSAPTDPDTQ